MSNWRFQHLDPKDFDLPMEVPTAEASQLIADECSQFIGVAGWWAERIVAYLSHKGYDIPVEQVRGYLAGM